MSDTLRPDSLEQVADALEWAVAGNTSFEVVGHGSKRGLGRPSEADHVLDLSGLSGIDEYEPGELYVSAKAGTPLVEVEALLSTSGQHLNFEPPDFGPLLGEEAGRGTLGGLIACNLAGPRRIQTGATRDHFLGFNAVSGRAEVFKSGGRVVKNVTGFDLSKLVAGSYGTLAVLADVVLKVVPKPEKVRTVLIEWATDGVYDHGGVQALTDALGSANEVSGAAHLPGAVARRSNVDRVSASGRAVTAVRVEGPKPSVEHRARSISDLLGKYGRIEELHTENSRTLWKEIGDVAYFAGENRHTVWRISVPPADGSRVALKILEGHPGEVFYDWGGGLVWLALAPADRAGEDFVRHVVDAAGGHATLVRAPAETRTAVPVFHPQPDALGAVSKRVKDGFDPQGILNPGRMYEGA